MNLKCIIYLTTILFFSCLEPTLISDKDCNEVIGGDALVDDCGFCTGGTTNLPFNYFWGCDGECIGSQFDCTYPGDSICSSANAPESCIISCKGEYITDCTGECTTKNLAKENDLCGVCNPCGDGTKGDDCNVWNSSCAGCTDPLATCNSFDNTATIYKEGDCEIPNYYCEIDTATNLLDIDTIVSDTCYLIGVENDCGPGKRICKILDCSDSDLDTSFTIPCNPVLMQGNNPTDFLADSSNIGNGECDYYGVQNGTIINILSCPEFDYDGGTPPNFTDGDCNQIDCRGVHFSDDLCAVIIEPNITIDTILIDTSTDFPDTTMETTIITTKITGCYLGEYSDSIRTEMIYKFASGRPDSILIVTDSIIVVGTTGWLHDGECDSDGVLFKDYGLDFNCVEFDYEGGDCYSLGRLDTHVRKKSISKKLYQVDKKKINLNYLN